MPRVCSLGDLSSSAFFDVGAPRCVILISSEDEESVVQKLHGDAKAELNQNGEPFRWNCARQWMMIVNIEAVIHSLGGREYIRKGRDTRERS